MKLWRKIEVLGGKPVILTFCPPQIPGLAWDLTLVIKCLNPEIFHNKLPILEFYFLFSLLALMDWHASACCQSLNLQVAAGVIQKFH